jgi:hypothetical protein
MIIRLSAGKNPGVALKALKRKKEKWALVLTFFSFILLSAYEDLHSN